MQTVPSLIGSGTAIAAAATGLVFGQRTSDGRSPSPSRRISTRRGTTIDPEATRIGLHSARPATHASAQGVSATPRQDSFPEHEELTTGQPPIPRRPSQAPPVTSPTNLTWRPRPGELGPSAAQIAEDSRDSTSTTNGSWMRRLSLRPVSHHESCRSSIGPGSPSIFSHGSGAPIIGGSSYPAPQHSPNKLVKRSSAHPGRSSPAAGRRSSRAQMPTLRRPATSHQRSATLQLTTEAVASPTAPAFELAPPPKSRARAQTSALAPHLSTPGSPPNEKRGWRSFFHAKITRTALKVSAIRRENQSTIKRIRMEGSEAAYLVTPQSVVTGPPAFEEVPWDADTDADTPVERGPSPQSSTKSDPSPGATPLRSPRRSASNEFSHPFNWVSKTGDIRRRKRSTAGLSTEDSGSPRPMSDPVSPMADSSCAQVARKPGSEGEPSKAESDLTAIFHPPNSRSNSPLPSLSRLSSFHVDLHRLGASSAQAVRPEEAPGTGKAASQRVSSNNSQTRTLDRASATGSSEYHRGFTSGDDDDTDCKTDTAYDSLRTVASVAGSVSGRRRNLDSPAESMFDESPPNTGPKRQSIQDILGPGFDGENMITEEDESLSTPVGDGLEESEAHFRLANLDESHLRYIGASPNFPRVSTDFGRLSFDDDDDLDWAREDELPICNHLSPPGSMNSRKGSPSLRIALASITSDETSHHATKPKTHNERPRSNIFDWAEMTSHDGPNQPGRPRTVHGKQELDMRGGRHVSRTRPVAAHVRSQSVSALPDPMANTSAAAKTVPKFGTWGLRSKPVSEDWDEDFEFDEDAGVGPSQDKKAEKRLSIIVPTSIQATQPTVKAHSGQIRELSLLVNDLKRLCRLAKDMDMLKGSAATVWREAEGIIALASPDEDDAEAAAFDVSSGDFDPAFVDERFVDEGFDGGALDEPSPRTVPEELKTAVVKERPVARRRSVFSPDDDIFGNFPSSDDDTAPQSPHTPEAPIDEPAFSPSCVARSLMDTMQLRRRQPMGDTAKTVSPGKVNFDTNSLKELVRRAGDLRDVLSDLVRKADHIAPSPVHTPRRERCDKNDDGSPAFTRVFEDPSSSPVKRLPHSRSSTSILNAGSAKASPGNNGMSQRLQMMTVN